MKKALKRKSPGLYYFEEGVKKQGPCSGLSGDCSGLSGDCSGLSGYCTGLSGYCTGLRGNCTGLSGDLNDCDISPTEREQGVDIKDLIGN